MGINSLPRHFFTNVLIMVRNKTYKHLRIHHHLRVLVSRGLYKAFTLLYFIKRFKVNAHRKIRDSCWKLGYPEPYW